MILKIGHLSSMKFRWSFMKFHGVVSFMKFLKMTVMKLRIPTHLLICIIFPNFSLFFTISQNPVWHASPPPHQFSLAIFFQFFMIFSCNFCSLLSSVARNPTSSLVQILANFLLTIFTELLPIHNKPATLTCRCC